MDDYEEEDENIGENGMSPMELHRRAMEKLDPNNFKGKDGQINFEFLNFLNAARVLYSGSVFFIKSCFYTTSVYTYLNWITIGFAI
jgi:hypothetical protein